MIALTLFGFALSFVFVRQDLLPYLAAQEAQAAVRKKEGEVLDRFEANARRKGFRMLGWQTQSFPHVSQVTYIYQEPGKTERKAFWWAYKPKADEGEKVNRITSVAQFVDEYLLPNVQQLHARVTGIPGPFAVVRHQEETY
jgi:hypothetical protein